MTTIAYRDGWLAVDTCITHEDHDPGMSTSRTYACKMKDAWPGSLDDPRIFIASKGDADAGRDVDNMILDKFMKGYRQIKIGGMLNLMNSRAELAKRLKMIGESDYGAIAVVFSRDKVSSKWSVYGAYEVNGSGVFEMITAPYVAIGCDKAVALGALHAGGTASDAVRAAATHGVYTALPMHVAMVDRMNDSTSILFRELK